MHGGVSTSPSAAAATAHCDIVSMAGNVELQSVGAGTDEFAKHTPALYLEVAVATAVVAEVCGSGGQCCCGWSL
jgi:hypothetical protein